MKECKIGCKLPDPKKKKGWWGRYLERLAKISGGKALKCCPK